MNSTFSLLNDCTWFLYSSGNDRASEHRTILYIVQSQYTNTIQCVQAHWRIHFECVFHFPKCNLQWERAARTCRLLGPFECASLSALLKRTATITQAGAGSPTLRSGTVAFNLCVAPSKSRTYLHQ